MTPSDSAEASLRIPILLVLDHPTREVTVVHAGLVHHLHEAGYRVTVAASSALDAQRLRGMDAPFEAVHHVDDRRIRKELSQSVPNKVIRSLLYAKRRRKSPKYSRQRTEASRQRRAEVASPARRLVEGATRKAIEFLAPLISEHTLSTWLARTHAIDAVDRILASSDCEAVLVAGAGAYGAGPLFLAAATRAGVSSVALGDSWDSLDANIYVPHADQLWVWGKPMADEAIVNHEYDPARVKAIGMIRAGLYTSSRFITDRAEFLESLGAPRESKLILIAENRGDSRMYIEVVRALSRIRVDAPITVVFRPRFRKRNEALAELLELPNVRLIASFDFDLPEASGIEETSMLVNLVAHCDLCVSVLSTLILESLILDKPNISLALPGLEELMQRDFVRPILESPGLLVARTEAELVAHAERSLRYPLEGQRERREMLERFIGSEPGLVHERVTNHLEDLIS